MTIINKKHQYIFVHVPKAAGKSIKQHLLNNTYSLKDRFKLQLGFSIQAAGSYASSMPLLNKLSINPLDTRLVDDRIRRYSVDNNIVTMAHLRALDLRSIFGDKEFNSMYSFGFVRNPWDRCLSAYWYFRRKTFHPLHKLAINNSFEDFLESQDKTGMPYVGQQSNWLFDEQDKQLVNYIGKVESISCDMSTVNRQLRIPLDSFTANTNISKRRNRDYRPSYSDKSQELVANNMQRDIGLLGYTF